MNYAVVAIGGLIVCTMLAWVLWGRYHFTGIVETTLGDQEEDSPEVMEEITKGEMRS